ncbi:MAG TPA: M23 family metallopeptidase [Syntrophales bacterium]|nr:M23 family metallopeptidase [Syntrophales bacterium]HOX95114.1 M23 family metallopeptidase [Syntrophales bacterium]HPI55846.1 M23 family metallopeptidase [Syntrophales bacterium]HPN23663.1 M23 family metallopeptidase [Syntrophales bacterium]HQM27812.1 M23 family metallopeptidase [Syntrophales bacterium]
MKQLKWMLWVAGLLVIVLAVWVAMVFFEMEKPVLTLKDELQFLGPQKSITFMAVDRKSGLRDVQVTLTQNDMTHMLLSRTYPQKGVQEEIIHVETPLKGIALKEGEAVLSIVLTDYSPLKNTTRTNVHVQIDMAPPQIFLLNTANNVNPGGSGITLYSTSEELAGSGVLVGEDFFSSFPLTVSGKSCYLSVYALPLDAHDKKTRMAVMAEDRAGNRTYAGLPAFIRNKKFRSDRITISQGFLDQKMPEFAQRYAQQQKTPIEVFFFVNGPLREENSKQIAAISKNSTGKKLWEGTFLRMKNAAPMASFGDDRTYLHEGKAVTRSLHLGVDLASTERATVEAANHGTVLFTGYLGIYGNTVILDHGLGLTSLYAHLSEISVKKGQDVRKGEPLGLSGSTGFAGGDHLHFSILVGGKFVNPIEWWDPHWLKDNVDGKMAVTF